MSTEDAKTAMNHPANCSVYDDGRCTCGKWKPPAEPVECQLCAVSKAFHDVAVAERNLAWHQCDGFRAEAKRLTERIAELTNALASISLTEYESTSSASEKVHDHARIARRALYGDKA